MAKGLQSRLKRIAAAKKAAAEAATRATPLPPKQPAVAAAALPPVAALPVAAVAAAAAVPAWKYNKCTNFTNCHGWISDEAKRADLLCDACFAGASQKWDKQCSQCSRYIPSEHNLCGEHSFLRTMIRCCGYTPAYQCVNWLPRHKNLRMCEACEEAKREQIQQEKEAAVAIAKATAAAMAAKKKTAGAGKAVVVVAAAKKEGGDEGKKTCITCHAPSGWYAKCRKCYESAVPNACKDCGFRCSNEYCAECFHQEDERGYAPCDECDQPSPLVVCLDCTIFPYSVEVCENCNEPSQTRFCQECFETETDECLGCGEVKQKQSLHCIRCAKVRWQPCYKCAEEEGVGKGEKEEKAEERIYGPRGICHKHRVENLEIAREKKAQKRAQRWAKKSKKVVDDDGSAEYTVPRKKKQGAEEEEEGEGEAQRAAPSSHPRWQQRSNAVVVEEDGAPYLDKRIHQCLNCEQDFQRHFLQKGYCPKCYIWIKDHLL